MAKKASDDSNEFYACRSGSIHRNKNGQRVPAANARKLNVDNAISASDHLQPGEELLTVDGSTGVEAED